MQRKLVPYEPEMGSCFIPYDAIEGEQDQSAPKPTASVAPDDARPETPAEQSE